MLKGTSGSHGGGRWQNTGRRYEKKLGRTAVYRKAAVGSGSNLFEPRTNYLAYTSLHEPSELLH